MLFEYMLVGFVLLTDVMGHVSARVFPTGQPGMTPPAISNVSTHTCDENPYVNGCSVQIRSYRRIFQSECNRHDICYNCGSGYGISRRSCDIIFGQSIAERCDTARDESLCRMLTYVSYAGVRLGGRRRYSRFSPSWCADRWVSSCLYMYIQ